MYRKILQLTILTAVITSRAQDEVHKYSSVVIPSIPHVLQKPDFCGEACAAMYLNALGENMDQDYVFDRSGTDPVEGRGSTALELAKALTEIGFDVGQVWTPLKAESELEEQFENLHRDLMNRIPSIVCIRRSIEDDDEHFILVSGYDGVSDEIIFHDPGKVDGSYKKMDRKEFLDLWTLQGTYRWGVVRLTLDAREIEYGDAADRPTAADFAQHIMLLKKRVPKGFSFVIQEPFVLIGDTHEVELNAHARRIVGRATQMLKRDFFTDDPSEITDVWLFKDEASYDYHTSVIFGQEPDTPYGYYSERDHSIVMNIATGGGTLVHELVHPLMHANFPDCPPWLDEGLASLFEYPTSRNGHILGLINWRLPHLKQAIFDGKLPDFEWLLTRNEAQFYGEDPGTNYAQARYLAYFLQEKGILVDFYHEFFERRREDRDGVDTLKEILGYRDLSKFQKDWEKWIVALPTEQ